MMIKYNIALICILLSLSVYPSISISRWFSSSYHDLRFTLRRYGYCVSDLPPLKDHVYNETEYLIQSMRLFLDQANYDNEQLANITALMDNICRSDMDNNYPISVNIDIAKYNSTAGKENRCRAIDQAMDAMFYVFKRAALNKSEPLDFSSIQFYPNPADKDATYNLTDLINTSWIKSDTPLESICKITDSVKEYVHAHSSKSTAQDRAQQGGLLRAVLDLIDSLLDPILGSQKRLYWESSNTFEIIQTRIGNQLGNLRDGIGNRYRSSRDRITGLFSSSSSHHLNATLATLNATALNVTATNATIANATAAVVNATLALLNSTTPAVISQV